MHNTIVSTVLHVANELGTWVYPTSRGCGFFANITGVDLIVEITLPEDKTPTCSIRSVHVLPLDLGLLCYGRGPAAEFYNAFSVRADEPSRSQGLLNTEVQQALMRLWRMTMPRHSLNLDDHCLAVGVTPDQSGFASPDYLLFVLRHFAWISGLLRTAAQWVDPPSGLVHVYRSFRDRAQAVGLHIGTAPLVIAGKRGRVFCRARVKRLASLRYALVVEGVAPRQLGAEMTLRPKTALVDRWASDRVPMSFRDPVFEDIFEVFARRPEVAREHLSPEARQRFVALSKYGAVSAMDSEVRVESPRLMHDTTQVLAALSEVVALLTCLHQLPAARGNPLRPYR